MLRYKNKNLSIKNLKLKHIKNACKSKIIERR
nr:MAG TPA: hypothetical protein [Caudoviricetes sp.]DAQ87232.1 MAG TPA: hypothetical protein [Caudoviricetes sp.]DAS93930.1 MAG TPA: hypothetical protein [Caudoviricetes sp.]